jgi:hypothetical protein
MVLGAVIALAAAIPALADSGTTAQAGSVKGLSTRALAKAKLALRTSRGAKRVAKRAAASAAAAQAAATAAEAAAKHEATEAFAKAASAREVAGGAELKAKEAAAAVVGTRPAIGFAEGPVSTTSLDHFVKLAEGPSATVTVPQTGLVQVWAQAMVEGQGAVSLYEGNRQVEGQALECNGAEGVLFAAEAQALGPPLLAGTPAVAVEGKCAPALGAPGPVLIRTTAGEHTFELRYASLGEEPTFFERRLIVQALP